MKSLVIMTPYYYGKESSSHTGLLCMEFSICINYQVACCFSFNYKDSSYSDLTILCLF